MGPHARLMVDGVSNYDVPRALAFAKAVSRYEIAWFEQPLPIDDIAGMAASIAKAEFRSAASKMTMVCGPFGA